MKKNSYVFYASFDEALRELPDKSRLKLYDAISAFALHGEETNFTGIEKAVFSLIKPQLQANNARYENGLKGGRPKKATENQEESDGFMEEETKQKPKQNLNETKAKPNENENVNENVNNNSKKERKKEIYINNNPSACVHTCESHEEIMREYGLPEGVIETLKSFLRHCYLNKHLVTNEKLEDIAYRLVDRYGRDAKGMNDCINKAISGGYLDIKA